MRKMKKRLVAKTLLAVWLLGLFGVAGTAGPNALSVSVGTSQLTVTSQDPKTSWITLRIAGPGEFTSEQREEGSRVSWYLPAGAPDGTYRYDAYASQDDTISAGQGVSGKGASVVSYRVKGRFAVSGGIINESAGQGEVASVMKQGLTAAKFLLTAIANVGLSSTYAQDLTASSGIPTVNFLDTGLATQNVWDLYSIENGSACLGNTSGQFTLRDRSNANDVMSFCSPGDLSTTVPNGNSLIVDESGDVSLANGTLFLDRSSGNVGVGTIVPADNLHVIASSFPFIRIESTSSSNVGIELQNPAASTSKFVYVAQDGGVRFQSGGSLAAMTWEDITDNIGIGTQNPERRLHVEQESASETVPFLLSNPSGKVRFLLGANGQTWTFDNTGAESFAISRIGTGTSEFQVDSSGNLTVTGTVSEGSSRTIKDSIEPVDRDHVLRNLMQLDVSRWSYAGRTTRHIGPMAEDFYALFGLGPDAQHVAPKDMAGVALSSIQALKLNIDRQKETISSQSELLAKQSRQLDLLRQQVESLSHLKDRLARIESALPAQFVSSEMPATSQPDMLSN